MITGTDRVSRVCWPGKPFQSTETQAQAAHLSSAFTLATFSFEPESRFHRWVLFLKTSSLNLNSLKLRISETCPHLHLHLRSVTYFSFTKVGIFLEILGSSCSQLSTVTEMLSF